MNTSLFLTFLAKCLPLSAREAKLAVGWMGGGGGGGQISSSVVEYLLSGPLVCLEKKAAASHSPSRLTWRTPPMLLPDTSVTKDITSSGRGMVIKHELATDSQMWVKADSISLLHTIFTGAALEVTGDRVAVSAASNLTYHL